jgi:pyridoxal phosphate enzyme (YggS family)
MTNLAERLSDIQMRVSDAALRSGHHDVKLLAVTKTISQSFIAEAIELGLTHFGENRVQEALPKVKAFPAVEWHFIGRLQTNKVKDVVGNFHLIHSVDRWRLAEALQNQAQQMNISVRILAQINVGEENQKGGVSPAETADFLYDLSKLSHIRVEGLMAIPPYTDNPEETRPYFQEMYRLYKHCQVPNVKMTWLSMGMSGDFEVAVEEGSNLVRVGSALFGERN